MAVLKILRYPDPILRVPTKKWVKLTPTDPSGADPQSDLLDRLWNDLEDTLDAAGDGLALAANQIGIPWRMFVVSQAHAPGGLPPLIVNPEIVSDSEEESSKVEGCLSFPGFSKMVRRPSACVVEYETVMRVDGKHVWSKKTESLDGLAARMFQHEVDHLEGKLFVDDLPKSERMKIVQRLGKGR